MMNEPVGKHFASGRDFIGKAGMYAALTLAIAAWLTGCAANGGDSESGSSAKEGLASPGRVGTSIGDTAPDFNLRGTDGVPVSLARLRGQPLVLVFWMALCANCEEESPRINELFRRYEARGVRVLGINIEDEHARVQMGIKNFGIRYPVALDRDANVARLYNIKATPTIVFLDREGIVRYFDNELNEDYAERLDELIAFKRR